MLDEDGEPELDDDGVKVTEIVTENEIENGMGYWVWSTSPSARSPRKRVCSQARVRREAPAGHRRGLSVWGGVPRRGSRGERWCATGRLPRDSSASLGMTSKGQGRRGALSSLPQRPHAPPPQYPHPPPRRGGALTLSPFVGRGDQAGCEVPASAGTTVAGVGASLVGALPGQKGDMGAHKGRPYTKQGARFLPSQERRRRVRE